MGGNAVGVLVSGSGTNLQALLDDALPVCAVASNVEGVQALDRARQAAVAAAAFPLDQHPSRDQRDLVMADWLAERGTRLVVCAGYMHLLTAGFLARFPRRVINVHPALLPAFAGMHAIEKALAAGVDTTGVSVHYVDEGVDTGPIIRQEPVPIEAADTVESLRARVQNVEHRLLPEVVRQLLENELRSAT